MTDPFDTPAGRWGLIFHGVGLYQPTHSRQEWARIADAIRTADLLREGQAGVRGDDAWCSVATSTYLRLNDAGAYWHMRAGDQPRWHADQELILAWLNAPVVPAGEQPSTMLDAHGWHATFDTARAPDPADLSLLVDLAQANGVVGAPAHKVSLLTWVDEGVFRDDAFLVLLWPPNGPARGSSAVSRDALLLPTASTVDRIVGLLAGVASVANTLMNATDAAESARIRPARRPRALTGWPQARTTCAADHFASSTAATRPARPPRRRHCGRRRPISPRHAVLGPDPNRHRSHRHG